MQLDNTAKAALIRQLLPLADDYEQWRTQLIGAGFDAFTVWEAFNESFAENEDELALHHKIAGDRVSSNIQTCWNVRTDPIRMLLVVGPYSEAQIHLVDSV